MKKNTGFTLIELMVALAVAAVLLTVGIPSFQTTIQNNRMATNSNKFLSVLISARSKAASTGKQVTVCKLDNPDSVDLGSAACGGNAVSWADGGMIWIDNDSDGNLDAPGEVLRVFSGLPSTLTINSENFDSGITYRPNGRANLAGRFIVCLGIDTNGDGSVTDADTIRGRSIIVSGVGRAHIGDNDSNGYPLKSNGTQELDCTP